MQYCRHVHMGRIPKEMRRNPRNVRFDDLRMVRDHYFGDPGQKGSHLACRMPWQGRRLVNIQAARGMAKPYQVRQMLKAIDRLEKMDG